MANWVFDPLTFFVPKVGTIIYWLSSSEIKEDPLRGWTQMKLSSFILGDMLIGSRTS